MRKEDLIPYFEMLLATNGEVQTLEMRILYEEFKTIHYFDECCKEWKLSVPNKTIISLDSARFDEVLDYIDWCTETLDDENFILRNVLKEKWTVDELLKALPPRIAMVDWGNEGL